MKMSLPQLALAAVSVVMLVALMVLMVKRKLRVAYPLFFTFLGLNVLAVAVLMPVYHYTPGQYFYAYWSASTVLMLVGFAVLYEVFVNILKPFSAVIDLAKMLFGWAALFLLLAAFLTALVTSGPSAKKIVVAVDLCDRCVHLMQCGLLMLLVLFEKRLNFSWRNSGMCIALGIGASAAIDLVVSYGQSRFPVLAAQFDMLNGVSFLAVLAFWALRLKATESAPATVAGSPSRVILQRWNEALISYKYGDLAVASNGIDSFLPGVEKTVDRVLARKVVH
jgi:hypothetical protein